MINAIDWISKMMNNYSIVNYQTAIEMKLNLYKTNTRASFMNATYPCNFNKGTAYITLHL